MDQLTIVNILLVGIFILVLVLPFKVKKVEENLEIFLFVCGIAALIFPVLRLLTEKHSGGHRDNC